MEIMDYEKIIKQMIADEAISKEVAAKYFPELKESEGERIVKAIKYGLDYVFTNNTTVYETTKEQCLAWLEKQGEHANFRNKIQIGDKVTRNEDGVLVNLSQLNRVAKKDKKQGEQKPEVKYVYTKFRIGDVIVEIKPNGYCQPVRVKYVSEESYSCESDDGKRFLSFPVTSQDEYKLVEQKPADKVEPKFKVGDKVKSIIDGFECTIESIDNICYYGDTTNFDIQDQDGWELVEQKPAEWTAEDEEELNIALNTLEEAGQYISAKWLKNVCLVPQTMQKSLKGRYAWKPSEEQMRVLTWCMPLFCDPNSKEILESLINDLKKLRER